MGEPEPKTYSLEEAAETLGVAPADVESYVAEGLVAQDRAGGATREFTRAQMRRLWSVVTLHRDLGINLPGVAAILDLRERYEQMRRDLALVAEIVERELGPDAWDRLWPRGRPRPATDVRVEEVSDLPADESAEPAGPGAEPRPTGAGGSADASDPGAAPEESDG